METAIQPIHDVWCVVIKRTGQPDEFMTDDTGAIRRFLSPTEAYNAGQSLTGVIGAGLATEAMAWRQKRGRNG